MTAWQKEEIEVESGEKASAQMPVIVSASRSTDIGEYNTCPHLCHYFYANALNTAALTNWKCHLAIPHVETITGK